ncbi:MAG: DUF1957 domain-containing protein [Firmicutes bacterium]|nr:DUF1957 domain-containing protein [Bacillota bacterium]
MTKGYLAIVLHAHLPYVRDLGPDGALEEDWLYEAIIETYIPLIRILEKLEADRLSVRLGLSITPPLLNMLSDKILLKRFLKRLDLLIDMSFQEVARTKDSYPFCETAELYQEILKDTKKRINGSENYVSSRFAHFQKIGLIEILASCATHGYLPLLNVVPQSQKAQIKEGINEYHRFFQKDPVGFWLPECGYTPGVDKYLADANIRYFLTDTHGVLNADTRPRYATYAPIYTPNAVAAFARDFESSKQVWSATEGYPGDFDYRDFYRDIGFDLDYKYLKPLLEPIGIRKMTGFKYHRITGKSDHKEPYNPMHAAYKAKLHAANFVFNREAQVNYLSSVMDRPPILVAPYDAELFGHWWFEGPLFLEEVLRLTCQSPTLQLLTPCDYLKKHPTNQVATPSSSSWGYNGYNEVWLENSNDWIYPHLHEASILLNELAKRGNPTTLKKRILNQASRELLLAQSSDWAFIMKTGTVAEYAIRRTKEHLKNFNDLLVLYDTADPNLENLERLEKLNAIFPGIDYRIFA